MVIWVIRISGPEAESAWTHCSTSKAVASGHWKKGVKERGGLGENRCRLLGGGRVPSAICWLLVFPQTHSITIHTRLPAHSDAGFYGAMYKTPTCVRWTLDVRLLCLETFGGGVHVWDSNRGGWGERLVVFVRRGGDAGAPREVLFYIITWPQATVWKANLVSGCWTGERLKSDSGFESFLFPINRSQLKIELSYCCK